MWSIPWGVRLRCCLGVLTAMVAPARADTHVLSDVRAADQRAVVLVVDDGPGCIAAAQLTAVGPQGKVRALGGCAVEVTGPLTSALSLRGPAGTAPIDLPPPTAAELAKVTAWTGMTATTDLDVILLVRSIPVAHAMVAVALHVADHGKPTSEVELNITSEVARLRALTWRAPGVATIELVVPRYAPIADLTITMPSGAHRRVELPVEPGPPIVVEAERPDQVRVGAELSLVARVRTTGGVDVPSSQVRVVALDGCAASGPDRFRCTKAGVATFAVQVEVEGRWIPVEMLVVHILPPLPASSTARLVPPAPASHSYWAATARASLDTLGATGGGVGAAFGRTRGAVSAQAGLAWSVRATSMAGVDPVMTSLHLTMQQLGAFASVEVARAGFTGRLALGPLVMISSGDVGGHRDTSLGFAGAAQLTVGRQLWAGTPSVAFELGAQALVDVVEPTWACAPFEFLAGVVLGWR